MEEIRLTSIATGVTGSTKDGLKTIIYGLDVNGRVWELNPQKNTWLRIHNPQNGELHNRPEDPGDDTPSWRNL